MELLKTRLSSQNFSAKKDARAVVWRENVVPNKNCSWENVIPCKVATSKLGGDVAPSESNIDGAIFL